jgi:hypothetical protein
MKRRTSLRNLLAPGLLGLGLASAPLALASPPGGWVVDPHPHARPERAVLDRVVAMPHDGELQARAARLGLGFVNVTWEDTGRDEGSAVGPNISDLTLQVREQVGGGLRTHLLPVLRYPNFTDRTGDVAAEKLWIRVGNERGGDLRPVRLTEVLAQLPRHLTDPASARGARSFLARRDTHFLVSAQHVFVPLPAEGKAEFNPVLFNYQSYPGAPAVLTLLVTREGTSVTVIDNQPGDQTVQGWGQQLYFNHAGQRTVFTAERRSAVERRVGEGRGGASDASALEEGADMMMLVQVPLMRREPPRRASAKAAPSMEAPSAGAAPRAAERMEASDVEAAVIGHGDDLGPFRELAGLHLVRDERFPVRVTVQFYKATSNGVVSDADLAEAHRAIERVYEDADYVGSLVVPGTSTPRPTRWERAKGWLRAWGRDG